MCCRDRLNRDKIHAASSLIALTFPATSLGAGQAIAAN